MTYELGRAQFIVDFETDAYFEAVSKAFNETTKKADELTKQLAAQHKVREKDVRAGAAIILAENKKLAADILKEERALANERKKSTQELIKYYADQYKQDLAAKKLAEQEKAKAEKAAKEDVKKNTQELLKYNQQQYALEIAAKKKAEQEKLKAEREAANTRKAYTQEVLKYNQRVYQEEIRAAKEAERAKEKAARDAERNQRKSGLSLFGYNPQGIKGDIATLLGFGAIASGAIVLREAIVKVTEATTKQEQAQRSLNASFGATQILFKQTADDYAEQFNRVSSTVEQSTAVFGTLNTQTNLTGEQVRQLVKLAIEVQAAYGGDLQEAFRSTAGAVLGETEAFEKYGLVLQEGVLKSSDKLTESERKRFTTMSESEKQMIRYRLLMEHLNQVQGTAAKRADETAGGFDKLARGADEFAKTIGSTLIPEIGRLSGALGGALLSVNEFLKGYLQFRQARDNVNKDIQNAINDAASAPLSFESIGRLIQAQNRRPNFIDELNPNSSFNREIQAELDRANAVKATRDEILRRLAAEKEEEENAKKAANDQRAREDAAQKVREERVKKQLQVAHDAEVARIEEEKRMAEISKRLQLEDIDAREKAELQRLEETEYARRQASEAEMDRIKNEKDAALQAADDRQRSELRRIEREKEAAHAVAEEQLKEFERVRDAQTRASDNRLSDELERLENEKEARDRFRKQEDYDIAASVTKRERLLEDQHQKVLRRLEREGEAARERYDKEIQKIEDSTDATDKRSERRIKQIDREAQRQIDAIDEQLRAFEEAERRRDAARRRRQLGQQLSDAQLALRQAQGSGDANAAAQARDKLVGAIRLGDPTAIKKAQDELAEIVGQGTRAVELAQRELANVQQDLRDNDEKETEDTAKEKLQTEKDRIKREADAEKQQEQDRDKRRKDNVEKEKRAAKEKLDDALKGIEQQKEAEEDANRDAKRELDDLVKYNKRKLDETRDQEDQANEDAVESAQKRHKQERQEIDDTYNSQKDAIERSLKELDTNYEQQTEIVQDRYRTERQEIESTYAGLAAALKLAEENARRSYEIIVRDTKTNFDAAREAVNKTFRADDGESGILDKFDRMKKDADDRLEEVKLAFENSKNALVGEDGVIKTTWEDALNQAKAYFDEVERRTKQQAEDARNRPRRGTVTNSQGIQVGPDPGLPGSIAGPGDGMGTTPNPPGTTGTSGRPDPEQDSVSIAPDSVDDQFSVSFGYAQPYTGNYTPGPGWEGGAAWPGGPSHHKGVDLTLPGPRNGYGSPIPAFHSGNIISAQQDSRGPGGNMLIIQDEQGRTHWYLHLKDFIKTSGHVNRGDLIAHLGDTGTEEFPHLHYEVRNGFNNGPMSLRELRESGIDPMPYVRGRDSGYTFRNPTFYQDMRTGEKGVLAEYGAERLLGRRETQQMESMGLTRILANRRASPVGAMNMTGIGTELAGMTTTVQNINQGGDNLTYYGVAPENLMKQWRNDQRKQRVLRGRHPNG